MWKCEVVLKRANVSELSAKKRIFAGKRVAYATETERETTIQTEQAIVGGVIAGDDADVSCDVAARA